jgi:Uma2 family endonuclease
MPALTIELSSQADQDAFNLRRWDELLSDPVMVKIEGRVETDRHGQVIMSPPPSARHGSFQFRIADALRDHLTAGEIITECPVSTADGVRAADVAWASNERMAELGNRSCFPRAPEICIEILSPRNTTREIEEKRSLYFDAGAEEVWICDDTGQITFFAANSGGSIETSRLCPAFPKTFARHA